VDGTRARRTRDKARQAWYARHRQWRFARFLGFDNPARDGLWPAAGPTAVAPPGTHTTNPRHERIAMFGIIMTTRGSPAPRSRPDRDRVYRFPGGEATGPEDREEPTSPSGRGRQASGSPAPGLGLFEMQRARPA
jgi:hypothetical protein